GGSSALLSEVSAGPDAGVVRPTGRVPTEPVELHYTLGRPATVAVRVEPAAGGPAITLRTGEALGAGPHFLLFSGVVPTDAVPGAAAATVARVLPDGAYRFVVTAAAGSDQQEASGLFRIEGAQTTPPALANLQVYPASISPNSDAIDDVAAITYRLPQTGTTSVTLQGATGGPITVLAPSRVPAGEQRVVFNGADLLGKPVPAGVYTITVRVEDRAGNAVAARRPLTVTDTGTPNIALLSVKMDPPALMLGGKLHVRMEVQNSGTVPLRTQGPDSGYTYSTADSYSSIAGGRYDQQAGLWRVGLDWEGNAGGAPYRYPFRWGFGHTLAPGEIVTIDGYVTIQKREQTMWFFAGALQEGVRIALDGLGRTPVAVSW
ncbi:MAG: hypothetical protein M3Z04_20170, partial [Chloroflexota bacterium]|nr:hypothetical protein [Chloroflexota bacterium]